MRSKAFPSIIEVYGLWMRTSSSLGTIPSPNPAATGRRKLYKMSCIKADAEEGLLKKVVDAVPDFIFFKDADGRYRTCNQACADYFGMRVEDIVGKTDDELFNPQTAEGIRQQDLLVYAEGKPKTNEEWVARPDGRRVMVEASKTPFFDEHGRVLGIIGIARDITDRKAIESALRESERRFRVMFEQASDPMILHDKSGKIVDVNEATCASLGYSREELIGAQPELYVLWRSEGPLGPMGPSGAVEYILSGGQLFAHPIHRRKDGSTFPAETVFRRLEFGGQEFVLAVARDITERKRAEDSLKAARIAAETANDAKTHFLAAASHDLRQPVQALKLLLHLLDERQDVDEQADIRAKMAATLASTEDMLAKLMEFAALESGKAVVRREVFALDELVTSIAREEEENAAFKNLRLRVHAPSCHTESDPVLLGRVLRNLVRNAIRYTERGGVIVAVRKRRGALRVEVWDSGRGIPAALREKVFDEFYQADNPERDRDKGMGLGLAIVRKTAEALGHPLSMKSVEGKGSVFAVELPLRDSEPEAVPSGKDAQTKGPATIVIVEDDQIQATALKSIFSQLGYVALTARDGPSAIGTVANLDRPPDLIISDFRLPGRLSGVDAISAIRRSVARQVPAVLVTGDTQAAIAEKAERIGCPVVHKPFSPLALVNLVESVLAEWQGKAA